MSVVVNGRRLGVARNGAFTAANTDPIPGGRLWSEAALTWNAMCEAALADGIEASEFVPAGPASSARTLAQQRWFKAHEPPPAAPVGASNHGWAIAVDVKTRRAAAWLLRHAHRFGWSWDEGRRVGEWWHWRYVGLSKSALRRLRRNRSKWDGYTDSEVRWITEYDRLKAHRRDPHRREVLRRVMRAQRKRVWRAGKEHGWTRTRRRRYESLKARTT